MSHTETVYLEYIHPNVGSPFAAMGYWSDPGATLPWKGTNIPNGETFDFVIARTDKTDAFQFEAVTLWYAAEEKSSNNLSRAARSFDKSNNSNPPAVEGISVSNISVKPEGNVTFTIDNQSDLNRDVTLGMQITVKDQSSNKESKNQMFTSVDPAIGIGKPN